MKILTRQLLQQLDSSLGNEALQAASLEKGTELQRITRLRKLFPADLVMAAMEQVELRKRALTKFSHAPSMWFTPAGLEQSSGEIAAMWRASRFPMGSTVADLCCGIGGDAMALAERGPVLAMDIDPAAAWCARRNLNRMSHSTVTLIADATRAIQINRYLSIDPSRRNGTRRAKSGEDYTPKLLDCINLAKSSIGASIKISPAANDEEIEASSGRVEFVSVKGECREAVLWFGAVGPTSLRSASLLSHGITVEVEDDVEPLQLSSPLEFLLEPDPALIRAHLLTETAQRLGGAYLLDSQIAYLTVSAAVQSPMVTCYPVLDSFKYSESRLEAGLKRLGKYASVIKKRGVAIEPDELRRKLKRKSDDPAIVVVTRVMGEQTAIICELPLQPPRLMG